MESSEGSSSLLVAHAACIQPGRLYHPLEFKAIWEYVWALPLPRIVTGPLGSVWIRKAPRLRMFGMEYRGVVMSPVNEPKRKYFEYRQA